MKIKRTIEQDGVQCDDCKAIYNELKDTCFICGKDICYLCTSAFGNRIVLCLEHYNEVHKFISNKKKELKEVDLNG